MSTRARAYQATHTGREEPNSIMPEFHAALERAGTSAGLDDRAIETLAAAVHLPIAVVRGAVSTYDDAKSDPKAIRVCAGTSCMLAGGVKLARELSEEHACRHVYCLGYCDQSPTAMTVKGEVVTGLNSARLSELWNGGKHEHPQTPEIRCVSRHAIVTARLGKPTESPEHVPEYAGLAAALELKPEQVLEMIAAAGLQGRGGAAFPTGTKLKLAAKAVGFPKYIVANGDEGDPGSFIDRELMERDPHGILEGMAIAAHAVGASKGVVFIRSEYPVSVDVMKRAIKAARDVGVLGTNALGLGKGFDVEVVQGLGSYVCGEETALLAAIEGQRGEVWPRPPYPIEAGLWGKPTVVDNVETLVNMPWIMVNGAGAFAEMGSGSSKGTKALCFDRGFARPGIVEVEFGMPLSEAIEKLAGGGTGGVELEAVLLGGPMGSIVTPEQWDAPICFSAMQKRGINLGHGGLVAITKPADWKGMLRHLLTFMREESCGKCVPCRMGTLRAYEMAKSGLSSENVERFDRILSLMQEASLCAFGRETPGPVKTIMEKFGDRILMEGNA